MTFSLIVRGPSGTHKEFKRNASKVQGENVAVLQSAFAS